MTADGTGPGPTEGAAGRCASCDARFETGEVLCSQCGARLADPPTRGPAAALSGDLLLAERLAFGRARENPDLASHLSKPHDRGRVYRVPAITAGVGLFLLVVGLLMGTEFQPTGRRGGRRFARGPTVHSEAPRRVAQAAGTTLLVAGIAVLLWRRSWPLTRRLVVIRDFAMTPGGMRAKIVGEDGVLGIVHYEPSATGRGDAGSAGVACFAGPRLVEWRRL